MEFLEILKAIVLGIVQGITEWLPISSTGHMILFDEFMRLNASTAFKDMFFVVIQLGSILAVVVLYFHKLNPFSSRKTRQEKHDTISLWLKVLIGIIPVGIIGILFDDKIHAIFYNYVVVAIALIVYGILFIVIENRRKNKQPKIGQFDHLDYKTAFCIGLFQVLSLIPGTSRSGSTILGGIIMGTSRYVAAEYSFFLAVPVMLGASAVKMLKFGFALTGLEWGILLTGTIVSFVVSVFAIRFLMSYIRKHDFKAFGWYRIILGIIVLAVFFISGFVK